MSKLYHLGVLGFLGVLKRDQNDKTALTGAVLRILQF